MKYLTLLFLSLSLLLCSCGNNDEPPLEVSLPISKTYLPASVEFNTDDLSEEQKRELIHLANNDHVITTVAELPQDPIGLSDAYRKINFNENTLLIKYVLHDYTIDTYSNTYYRDTKENSYNWYVNIGTASDTNVDTDNTSLTRFAILVRKLPADAKVRFWVGLTQLGWFPEPAE